MGAAGFRDQQAQLMSSLAAMGRCRRETLQQCGPIDGLIRLAADKSTRLMLANGLHAIESARRHLSP